MYDTTWHGKVKSWPLGDLPRRVARVQARRELACATRQVRRSGHKLYRLRVNAAQRNFPQTFTLPPCVSGSPRGREVFWKCPPGGHAHFVRWRSSHWLGWVTDQVETGAHSQSGLQEQTKWTCVHQLQSYRIPPPPLRTPPPGPCRTAARRQILFWDAQIGRGSFTLGGNTLSVLKLV